MEATKKNGWFNWIGLAKQTCVNVQRKINKKINGWTCINNVNLNRNSVSVIRTHWPWYGTKIVRSLFVITVWSYEQTSTNKHNFKINLWFLWANRKIRIWFGNLKSKEGVFLLNETNVVSKKKTFNKKTFLRRLLGICRVNKIKFIPFAFHKHFIWAEAIIIKVYKIMRRTDYESVFDYLASFFFFLMHIHFVYRNYRIIKTPDAEKRKKCLELTGNEVNPNVSQLKKNFCRLDACVSLFGNFQNENKNKTENLNSEGRIRICSIRYFFSLSRPMANEIKSKQVKSINFRYL